MPRVKGMIARGASTFKARAVLPTVSWPNWSSLFSGAAPEIREGRGDFPSLFTVLKNHPGKAGGAVLFYEWEPLAGLCDDAAAEKRRIRSTAESAREVAAYIREKKPVFTAVVFDEPDGTGHEKRWGSRAYYRRLNEMDGYIGLIEDAVKEAGIYDETVFVISADHGGSFWGHGHNLPKQRAIPLIIRGRGVKEGFTIPPPVSICDIAPTMAAILGLEIPGEWTGRPLGDLFQ
jgi:predicted AlkP superfamily pyrophosphatase or phosphodiesterase